jgi:ubiquinone/menaquinone biosynthesis C-methylase UbiE
MYFDGPREYGYGGYKYDGRWRTVARSIINEYGLESGMRVLDIGCAKGFLVHDLMIECPGLEVFGLDISKYAILNSHASTIGRLHLGSSESLPFPDNSFELVVSINTLHNLTRDKVIISLREINRVTKKNSYVVVDSYLTLDQKETFERWVLTAKFHDFPEGWLDLFSEAQYSGDYAWTIVTEEV